MANKLGRRDATRTSYHKAGAPDLVLRHPKLSTDQAPSPSVLASMQPPLTRARSFSTSPQLRVKPHSVTSASALTSPSPTPKRILCISSSTPSPPRHPKHPDAPFLLPQPRPQLSCARDGTDCRRLIEIAVTVHETPNWHGGPRTDVGSGFLERIAKQVEEAEQNGIKSAELDLRVPIFPGLMANPLACEFVTDGPMLLVGAGVGLAPFRGFVQRRLRSANCANKV